jgi:hypothetical protein
MMLNKDPQGDHYNRAFGADVNFPLLPRPSTLQLAAPRARRREDAAGTGDDCYSKEQLRLSRQRLGTRAMYQTIGSRFNDEMGFVPRVGVDNAEAISARTCASRSTSSWLREFFPHFQIENFTKRNGGGLESRYMDWHVPVNLQNSTFIEIGVNPNEEVIDDRFRDQRPPRHLRDAGRYEFKEYFGLMNTNAAAPFSMNLRYGNGEFYDGYRRNYTIGGTFRMNEHLNVSLSDQINDIELPSGAFVTHLVTGRVNYYFSTKVFVNALGAVQTPTPTSGARTCGSTSSTAR